MILASAQTSPKRFDFESNLNDHYELIKLAAENDADLILFPELSITGYERDMAKGMVFQQHDSRLSQLRNLSVKYKIIVIAGAPVMIDQEIFIGACIIMPDDTISIYTKQYLHAGEDIIYNSSFDHDPIIETGNERISMAICADINNPKHPESARKKGISIYLASIFWEPQDMAKAYKILSEYSGKHAMNILMSNYCGQSWGLDAGGKSGFWDKNGSLIANLNSKDPGLLLIENDIGNWKSIMAK